MALVRGVEGSRTCHKIWCSWRGKHTRCLVEAAFLPSAGFVQAKWGLQLPVLWGGLAIEDSVAGAVEYAL